MVGGSGTHVCAPPTTHRPAPKLRKIASLARPRLLLAKFQLATRPHGKASASRDPRPSVSVELQWIKQFRGRKTLSMRCESKVLEVGRDRWARQRAAPAGLSLAPHDCASSGCSVI